MISSIAVTSLATAFATALAPISTEMDISLATGQWMMSGYTLAMGIIMPLTAFLIRRFPTKPLYLIGISLTLTGLAISFFSFNFPMMMLGRVLQACGNGTITAMAQVIILSIYPEEKRGSAMGLYGLSSTVAPIFAPTLGGIIVDVINWRAIFGIVFCVMAISFIMAFIVFKNVLETENKRFDIPSFILSTFAFGGVTLGIGNLGTYGITSLYVWPILLIGAIAAVFFVRRQLHLDQPILDVRMLKIREYSISVISNMLVYFLMFGQTVLMPLLVQSALGMSATMAGLVTLPASLGIAILSPLAGRFYDMFGIKTLFLVGSLLLFGSNVGMLFVTIDTNLWVSVVLNIFRSLGVGCLMMPIITWGTSHVERRIVADATAMLNSMGSIAGSIGSAVLVAVMTSVAAGPAASYGEAANMIGANAAFGGMAIISLALIVIGLFFIHGKKKDDHPEYQEPIVD